MQPLISLRIQGDTVGSVADAAGFLAALGSAYENLNAFEILAGQTRASTALGHRARRPLLPLSGIADLVLPGERLTIGRVSFASPGFWEFIGTLNPLSVIREYLNVRHRRRQDHEYREAIEKQRGELELASLETTVLRERLDLLRAAGFSEEEIRRAFAVHVIRPLLRLNEYQDKGLAVYANADLPGPPPGFAFPTERPRSAAG